MKVFVLQGQEQREKDQFVTLNFSSGNACDDCGITLPEPSSLLFSFYHPVGACPDCKGFGDTLRYDEDLIVPDRDLSLGKGAVDPWNKPAAKWWKKQLQEKGRKAGLDLDKPYAELSPEQKDILFKGVKGFYGIEDFFEELQGWRYKPPCEGLSFTISASSRCSACNGKRLKKEVLAYKISGVNIADLSSMPVVALSQFFSEMDLSRFKRSVAKELLRQISLKIEFLAQVGLGYPRRRQNRRW